MLMVQPLGALLVIFQGNPHISVGFVARSCSRRRVQGPNRRQAHRGPDLSITPSEECRSKIAWILLLNSTFWPKRFRSGDAMLTTPLLESLVRVPLIWNAHGVTDQ